jgi:hypothetical protein
MSVPSHSFLFSRALCRLVLMVGMVYTAFVHAQVSLTQLSEDTLIDAGGQHHTEVEPGTFSSGSTMVTAFQVGRNAIAGGADVGFATSTDGGASWTNGYLPGITTYEGGTYQAASDPTVAYDALHKVWLIATLVTNFGPYIIQLSTAMEVSRSTDGINWSNPIMVTGSSSADKEWIVCDNPATSPYYGHCYSVWFDFSSGLIQMSTSIDGGQTWGPALATAGNDCCTSGVPVVQPNGKVIVPFEGPMV